jgi:hypothetical protein
MSEIKVNKISPRSGTTLTLGDSGDDFVIPAGATLTNNGTASGFASIAWQSTIVTGSTLTAVAGNGYWIDTTSNACTVTLPGSASVGDQIIFVDYKRTWGTNAVTINQNSLNFQGYSSPNPVYNTSGQSVSIVYSGATQGWIPTVDDDVTNEVPQTYTVDFLVIAGGGGGVDPLAAGTFNGGGAGAGGYRNSYNSESSGGGGSAESSLTFNGGTVYTITVGAGGSNYVDGNDSSISGSDITTITSTGGGAGAGNSAGRAGGSGGGGASSGGTGNPSAGSGTANQGYAGATGGDAPNYYAGGGGGAGEAGNTDGNSYGGDGVASTITGSSVTRGGGGGGAQSPSSSVPGGAGGGGDGGNNAFSGTSGTANTGGGAGGSGAGASGATSGGSGVVILRMADGNYSGTTTGSPTVTTGVDGTDTVLVFNASGSYTA